MPTWETIFANWKSTAKGLLIFVITTCGVLTQAGVFDAKAAGIVAVVTALAYAYLGLISRDAGTASATIAGQRAVVEGKS